MKVRSKLRRILAMTLAIVMTLSVMVFPVSAEEVSGEVSAEKADFDLGLKKGDDINAKLSALITPGKSHEWEYLYATYTYKDNRKGDEVPHPLWSSVNGSEHKDYTYDSYTITGLKLHFRTKNITCESFADNSMLGKIWTVRAVGSNETCTVKIVDGRIDTVIAVKDSITVSYKSSKSADDYYKEIFETAIIKSKSTLPENFTYSNINVTVSGLPSGDLIHPIKMDTTHSVTIAFAGDDYYKKATATVSVFIADPRMATNIVAKDSVDLDYRPSKDRDDYYKEVIDAAIIKDQSTLPEDYTVKSFNISGLPKDVKPDTTYTVKFSFAGDKDNYKDSNEVSVTVNVVDNRIVPEITANDSVTITYNMDKDVMLQEIIDKAIVSSNLPEGYTAADFEISAPKSLDANVDEGDEPYTVTFYYKETDDYKQSETYTVNVTVQKANVTVTIKGNINDKTSLAVIKAGGELPEDFITLDPNDSDIDVWTIFAGKTNEGVTIVYVDLPARYKNEVLIGMLDWIFKNFVREDGKTFTELVSEGMTVGEFKELMKDLVKAYEWAEAHKDDTDEFLGIKYPTEDAINAKLLLAIMPDTVVTIAEQITKLPDVFDDTVVAFGTPKHAGVYATLVVTESKNYNAAYAFGGVLVAPKYEGNVLLWNTEFPESNTFTVSELNAFDLTASLYNDDVLIDDAKISYKYTGSYKIFWFIKVDYSSEKLPTRAGSYTEIATCYVGDNISILPITRSFTLTKD